MFELPSREDVQKCIITVETVRGNKPPKLIRHDGTVIEQEQKTSA
jgi:ATP-dependent Clp protease ATP-binding subunit ClpX